MLIEVTQITSNSSTKKENKNMTIAGKKTTKNNQKKFLKKPQTYF